MNPSADGRYSVVGRLFAAGFLLAIGLAAALPFRNRERVRPTTRKATTSDNVRLVLRQDITLQVNPRVEESPAGQFASPFPAVEDPHNAAAPQIDEAARLPELPSQYRSLLDPNSTAPKGSRASFGSTAARTPPPTPPAPREHVLTDGDTLARLAERYLGDPSRANDILALNSDVIFDPNLLPIGRIVRIPPRTTVTEPLAQPRDSSLSTPTSIVREPTP